MSSGGVVSSEVISFLRDASWPSEIASAGATAGHAIYANDLCALKDAFVALYAGKLACWGNSSTCTGWNTILGSDVHWKVTRVFCITNGYAAIPILDGPSSKYGAWLSIFGRPANGGQFPENDTNFSDTLRSST